MCCSRGDMANTPGKSCWQKKATPFMTGTCQVKTTHSGGAQLAGGWAPYRVLLGERNVSKTHELTVPHANEAPTF